MKSIEHKLLGQLYCFCGGGDDVDDGDTGDTGIADSVMAGGRGLGPSRGPEDNDESSNRDQDRRVQSNGQTVNVNIDRSQPSVVADINGTQRTVYGTQADLDSAIASGALNPVGNVQDNYTPGTREASEAYSSVIADQEDALGFAPGAAAGPALADTNIFSPVARAMSPFERTLAAASRPQTADEKLADLARTDRRAALQQYLDVNPNQSVSYANTYLDALIDADSIAALPSSPENQFKAREYSPVDAVNIFDQFEQPIDANNPPTALDPSRPMTQIRAATPAEQITQEARAAANQSTPDMQPTTTEVDAYNAALNAEIADSLGIASYDPATFSPMRTVQQQARAGQFGPDVAGMPEADIAGLNRPFDFSDLEATDLAEQNIVDAVNKATQEVALEAGVSPQLAAQATGVDVARFTDPLTGGISDTPTVMSNVLDYYETPGATVKTTVGDDAYRSRPEDGSLTVGVDYKLTPRAGRDFNQAVAEEEAFRASQAEQATRAAEQQADADQFMDVSAIDVTRPTNQELVAQGLQDAGLSESAIQRGVVPEGTLPGDEEQGAFLGENIVRDPRPMFENPLADVPYFSGIGEVGTDVVNSVFRSSAQVDDMISKGAQEITDESGFRIGAFDPRSKTVFSVAGESFNPALEPYYAQQREAQAARQDQGGGDARVTASVEEAPAEATPEEYVGQQIVKPYQYQPREPLSYAYTGLPSLAPQTLRPSYRAPRSFSPLFPVS